MDEFRFSHSCIDSLSSVDVTRKHYARCAIYTLPARLAQEPMAVICHKQPHDWNLKPERFALANCLILYGLAWLSSRNMIPNLETIERGKLIEEINSFAAPPTLAPTCGSAVPKSFPDRKAILDSALRYSRKKSLST